MLNSAAAKQATYSGKTTNGAFSQDVKVLTRIFEDDINLACWQRELSSDIQSYLVQLIGSGFNQLRCVTQLCDVIELLHEKLPDYPGKTIFVNDLYRVADMYACLFEVDDLGLRLTKLTSAMCPRFHTDKLPCRLITTYAGCGTEWLPDNEVNREYLGPQGHGKEDKLYPDNDSIQQLTSGDLALFKGDGWQGNEGRGIVHRSPALLAGQCRVVLTLDGR